MESKEIKKILEYGKESPSLEFKQSEPWGRLKNKLTRCVLAMSNIRDGGHIVIGVKDNGELQGIFPNDVDTYKEEEMRDYISNFADPFADFDVHIESIDGKNFVSISVREFSEVPVICKKDGDSLRKGAIYVRTVNRRPESVEVPDFPHMREILEIATDKMNEKLKRRGWFRADGSNPDTEFKKQLEDLDL